LPFFNQDSGRKFFREGTERTVTPGETVARAQRVLEAVGVSRVADITGLDHIGIPVAAAYRPNARSVSVSQGKGVSLEAAMASAIMEAIEGYHAERVDLPLKLASPREMAARPDAVALGRLSRTTTPLHGDAKLLWVEGFDLKQGETRWVPLETILTDFTRPAVGCSGSFLMSSNGLASGNHLLEAVSHAICELIERDANTLWHFSSAAHRDSKRLELASVTEPTVERLLERLSAADVLVGVWETTTDIGIPCFICQIGDRRARLLPLPPSHGSGCHPRKEVALARAITEAAQGRLTRIAAVREDLDDRLYSPATASELCERLLLLLERQTPTRSFEAVPTFTSATFAEDVDLEISSLSGVGLESVIMVDLTRPEFEIPVVKLVVPGLEGIAEVPTYVPGVRAEQWKQAQHAK
jgi:YcaO-like protein with predicted kinase domain